ncbi:MAG: hypothetical protein ACKO0X_09145 [Bacteroidota bacterium]
MSIQMKNQIKGMLIACLFLPSIAAAQNEIDALRYSQTMIGPTARSLAMGGAFGALGGDYTCLSTNPAGLGIYRKSDFSVSLGFAGRNYKSDFGGTRTLDDRFDVDVPNLGVVLASGSQKEGGAGSGIAFGIAYNRLASFNNSITFKGRNEENSILDSFLENINANGGTPSNQFFDLYPFDGDLAYQTYLINPTAADSNLYNSAIPNGGISQSMSIESSGYMGEFSLGLAGKVEDYVFVGLSMGFPNIDYEENKSYSETDEDGSVFLNDTSLTYRDFRALKYENYLRTTGNGFNLKAGVLVMPVDWLRLGLAVHTPTWFFMSDIYSNRMQSEFANGSFDYASPEGNYTYKLYTSWRSIASLGFVFGKSALLSLEGEMVQYPRAKLKASDYNFQEENLAINTQFKSSTFNFRAGGEWRYEPFAVRAGISYYGSPFVSSLVDSKTDQSMLGYSGGVGYRGKKYYLDLGFVTNERGEAYKPYSLKGEPVPYSTINRSETRVVVTFGKKF